MKILFVDDEREILSSIKRQLRKEKFVITTCTGGKEALDILEKEEFNIIVSDERMPDISGLQLMKEVKKKYPDTIRMILSGYADSQTIIDSINLGEIFRFIPKPWNFEDLITNIKAAQEKWEINNKNKEFMQSIIEENLRLKKRLSYRGSKLDLSNDILDQVPSPIIIVGKDDTVEVFNSKTESIINMKLHTGQNIKEVIPESLYTPLEASFKENGGSDKTTIKFDQRDINVFTRGLRPTDEYKGILILQPVDGDIK